VEDSEGREEAKLRYAHGFSELRERFKGRFRGRWPKDLDYDGVLQKTQAMETELMADIMLVDMYGDGGRY